MRKFKIFFGGKYLITINYETIAREQSKCLAKTPWWLLNTRIFHIRIFFLVLMENHAR